MSAPSEPRASETAARRWAAAFGRFWWDFLVGDTPELLVGAVFVVVAVALAAHNGVARALTVIGLPGLVVVLLGASLMRARARHRRASGAREKPDAVSP